MDQDTLRQPGRYIYGLTDPDGSIRYVGKVKGYLNSRFRGHLYEARHGARCNHRLNWIRSLLTNDAVPGIVCLEICDGEDDLVAAERRWIAALRSQGCDLVNATDGGEGMENPSPETREKLRRRPRPQVTDAIRRARSEAAKARWADPQFRARMQMTYLLRYGPPKPVLKGEELRRFRIETAKRMGALNKGRRKSAEHREKLSQATRRHLAEHGHPFEGQKHSEETRAKMRTAWLRRKGVMP